MKPEIEPGPVTDEEFFASDARLSDVLSEVLCQVPVAWHLANDKAAPAGLTMHRRQ